MPFYPTDTDKAIAVVYDLRDASQWTDADEVRRAWGRERPVAHTLDNDHILIEYEAGGAREISA